MPQSLRPSEPRAQSCPGAAGTASAAPRSTHGCARGRVCPQTPADVQSNAHPSPISAPLWTPWKACVLAPTRGSQSFT